MIKRILSKLYSNKASILTVCIALFVVFGIIGMVTVSITYNRAMKSHDLYLTNYNYLHGENILCNSIDLLRKEEKTIDEINAISGVSLTNIEDCTDYLLTYTVDEKIIVEMRLTSNYQILTWRRL